MSNIEFLVANSKDHRHEILELNIEYMNWVCQGAETSFGATTEEILGMSVVKYVPTVIDKVCGAAPPDGIFYLVMLDGELAGMGGIRYVRKEVAEIKRIYFRSKHRGKQLGELMLNRLITDATKFGYKTVLLDTGPFMLAAHKLYERNGFQDCAPYQEAEVPIEFHKGWRFMQRHLP